MIARVHHHLFENNFVTIKYFDIKAIADLKIEVNEIRDEIKKSDERSLSVEQKLTSEIFLREGNDSTIFQNILQFICRNL